MNTKLATIASVTLLLIGCGQGGSDAGSTISIERFPDNIPDQARSALDYVNHAEPCPKYTVGDQLFYKSTRETHLDKFVSNIGLVVEREDQDGTIHLKSLPSTEMNDQRRRNPDGEILITKTGERTSDTFDDPINECGRSYPVGTVFSARAVGNNKFSSVTYELKEVKQVTVSVPAGDLPATYYRFYRDPSLGVNSGVMQWWVTPGIGIVKKKQERPFRSSFLTLELTSVDLQ